MFLSVSCYPFFSPAMLDGRITLDGVAAYVNDQAITVGDVMMVIEPMRRRLAQRYDGDELLRLLENAYNEGLQSLVERQLILQHYATLDRQIPEWVIENRLNEIIQEMFNDDREQLMDVLSEEGLTYAQWRERIREQIILSNMRSTFVDEGVHISPMAISKYYEENLGKYSQPSSVRIRMIVLEKGRTADDVARNRQLADDLHRRAVEGEDFALLAQRFSVGSRAGQGGDWDWIDPDALLRPELSAALAGLKPSQITPVIELGDLLYIIKLEGRRDEFVRSLQDVRDEIEQVLWREKSERIYDEWITRLRERAVVRYFERQLF